MPAKTKNIKPPNPPWESLNNDAVTEGCISVYLSDPLSRLPIRGIALTSNNKSDPNIETASYGLFSTCSRAMRSSAVNRRLRYLFFMTRWKGERVITGYYRLAWFSPGALDGAPTDYCLAADEIRFVSPPIRPRDLPRSIYLEISKRFRLFKLLNSKISSQLYQLISTMPDATDQYRAEVDRLERFNLFRSGFRYIAWKQREEFDWTLAEKYLSGPPKKSGKSAVKNSSPSDMWLCSACGGRIHNKALLKRCPNCGEIATLKPSK